ncbi:uncharacterized protein B0T23DRAFT_238357 [Neurospora hispaniola]|uniref:Peptidase C14 caspase domain-containing protein n=1 Tax=Neurospora hispaniola TaxID=588809 RepID=A0AAJ0HZM0_9PEZI|nr:hypothetical protein B0T23DRAFT_238357 [Neurospora hispaniola]
MNSNTDFTQLWHRHLANLRHDFSTGAVDNVRVQASPLEPARSVDGRRDSEATPRDADYHDIQATSLPAGLEWDVDIDMVIDALQELEVQSPITATEALSPDSPWFRDPHLRRDGDGDRDVEIETVASSPQNSSWSRTVAPPKGQRARLSLQLQPPKSPVSLYTSAPAEGLDTNARARTDWYRDHATLLSHSQQLYETYSAYPTSPGFSTARHEPETEPPEPKTRFGSTFSPSQRSRYAQLAEVVNVLILSWATTTTIITAKQQGPIKLSSSRQGINTSTDSVRNCFKRLGYRVQCRLIPEDYPTAAVETILAKFLADSDMGQERKKLLVIYYAGGAGMVGGRMVFANAIGSSHFFWEDIREPIMSSEGDVLLILDCHHSMRSNGSTEAEDQLMVDPGLASSPFVKQLLGAYVPVPLPRTDTPNSSSNGRITGATQMTQTLCRILDSAYARGDGKISVQRLCSCMKSELRQDGTELDQMVFVTQLGGRHLMDIELPVLSAGIDIGVRGGNDVGGGVSRGMGVLRG